MPASPGVIFSSLASIEATSAIISLLPGLSAVPGKVWRIVFERRMKLTLPRLLEASASRKKVSSSFFGFAASDCPEIFTEGELEPSRRSKRPIGSKECVSKP